MANPFSSIDFRTRYPSDNRLLVVTRIKRGIRMVGPALSFYPGLNLEYLFTNKGRTKRCEQLGNISALSLNNKIYYHINNIRKSLFDKAGNKHPCKGMNFIYCQYKNMERKQERYEEQKARVRREQEAVKLC